MTHDNTQSDVVEALEMCRDLMQEAKGHEGPNGGFVTNHLDAAEIWLDIALASLSTSSDAVLEEIAFNLTDQRDEPDMWLVSYERVQYWRDKAIKGAEAIRNLKASGDNA